MKKDAIVVIFLVVAAALAAVVFKGFEPKVKYAPNAKVNDIDAPGLEKAIKAHEGKVTLVDFWATWCPPCVRLFPHSVELNEKLADEGLVVITVSLDDLDSKPSVLEFLRSHGADMENYIVSTGASQETAEAFRLGDGIPFLRIYDRQGKVVSELTGPTPGEVDAAVKKALKSL